MLPHIKLAPSVIILYSALFSVRTDVYMLVLQLPEKLYYYIYIYIYIMYQNYQLGMDIYVLYHT